MAQQPKTYKFSKLKREAEKHRSGQPRQREIPPFVIDDVEPPIQITSPDTLERKLVIADNYASWRSGQWEMSGTIPLLQALCGDQFGRVWMMIKDDPDEAVMLEMIKAMFDHFSAALGDVEETADLPGGSGDSSN